ncbi:hypothetical protein BGZ97_002831, partial [Linnemannia gamsii]
MCRVNRHISRVATPFLYHDPFHLLKDYDNKIFNVRGYLMRCLLATLLNSIPVSQLHPALRLGMDIVTNPNTDIDTNTAALFRLLSPDCIKHIHYLHHFNLEAYTFLEYGNHGEDHKDYSPAELDYIHGQEFLNMYLIDRKDATCLKDPQSSERLMYYYPNVLYREATWSLSEPILERLESLSFPLSNTCRYLQMVERLGRLGRVKVYLDMVFDCECCDGMEDNNTLHQARRQRKKESFEVLVQFVKKHVKNFPGCLKTVTTLNSYFWEDGPQCCPEEVEHEIYAMLPLQYVPTNIISANWWKVMAHLETIDLGRVWQVLWLPPSSEVVCQAVLRRCRMLKWFTVESLPRGCFDWAVQEKKDLERLGHGFGSATTNTAATTVVRPTLLGSPLGRQQQDAFSDESQPPQAAYMEHGLVKLERVTLEECRVPSPDLDAVAFAFNQSLGMLSINALHAPENIHTIHFGQGWVTMHALFRLELQLAQTHRATHRLELDIIFYTRCPSLKHVKIKDETFEYLCQDVVPCLPADVEELSIVYLRGWSALTFHPAAFQSSKKVLVLKMSMPRRDGYCFIPPVEELEASYGLGQHAVFETIARRPRWTWDWHLPRLIDIDLTSEFAYLFEFRMLYGCPNLETLRLNMCTVDGLHTRTISETDLFVLGTHNVQERIVAPNLRKVYMNGRWIFESTSVLSQFLGQMFPAVKRFTARGWGGVSVGSLAEVLRTTAGHISM